MDLIQKYDPEFYLDRIEDEPLLQHYRTLHDGLSDLVECGQLHTMHEPDYQWLVRMLEVAAIIADKEEQE